PQGIRWLRDFLRSMAAQDRTILVSSHVLSEVSQTGGEGGVIPCGGLRARFPLAELTGQAERVRTVRARSPQADRLAELLGPPADHGEPRAHQGAGDTTPD